MLFKVTLFIGGVFMCSYALTFYIIYLNLVGISITYSEYFKILCTRYECISLFIGILMICLSFIRKKAKNDIYL